MQIKKSLASMTLLASLVVSPIVAQAQAISVRVGGVGGGSSLGSSVGSLVSVNGGGSLGATALGGGSLANVNVGSSNATVLPVTNGGGTTSLNDRNFFSANQSKTSAGFGDGFALTNTGTGGGGTQFGANGSVEAQATRKRVASAERARKSMKRRMSQIGIAN